MLFKILLAEFLDWWKGDDMDDIHNDDTGKYLAFVWIDGSWEVTSSCDDPEILRTHMEATHPGNYHIIGW